MSIEIRAVSEDELDAYVEACAAGFGDEVHEGTQDRVRRVIGLERIHAAFDDRSRIVGTMGSHRMQLAVPGGDDVATAGLTRVTVAPTHRRQGILTNMMETHFDQAAANGESLSFLWASEVGIYGRFGYAQIGDNVGIKFNAKVADLRPPDTGDSIEPVTIDPVTVDEAKDLFPEVRERSRAERPGQFRRSDLWWEMRRLPDFTWERNGGSPHRHVVARRDGQPVGYATYRQHPKWTDTDIPDGRVDVADIAAVDAQSEHNLWWFLSNIDLFPNVSMWTQPSDSILPWIARDPRGIKRLVTDGAHLRVLDIEAALSARKYDTTGQLVFKTLDPQRPALSGTYRLTVDDDGNGTCARIEASGETSDRSQPVATLSPCAIGGLYLGATPIKALVLNGHIEAEQSDLDTIRRLFTWPVAAWCDETF
ncbi:MAG: GNAT family N-acetyltransferase [Acidimicrobiales bacterium]